VETEKHVKVAKGSPHGWFAFGGSTILLLFKPETIRFDNDLLRNTKRNTETLVRVRTHIGTCIAKQKQNDDDKKEHKAKADARQGYTSEIVHSGDNAPELPPSSVHEDIKVD